MRASQSVVMELWHHETNGLTGELLSSVLSFTWTYVTMEWNALRVIYRKFRYTGPGPGEYRSQLEEMIVTFSKATASAAFHPPVSAMCWCLAAKCSPCIQWDIRLVWLH
jgi:hypothetical protein